MSIGITAYGSYIPRLRLSRQAVAQANAWYAPQFAGRKGTREQNGLGEREHHDADRGRQQIANLLESYDRQLQRRQPARHIADHPHAATFEA